MTSMVISNKAHQRPIINDFDLKRSTTGLKTSMKETSCIESIQSQVTQSQRRNSGIYALFEPKKQQVQGGSYQIVQSTDLSGEGSQHTSQGTTTLMDQEQSLAPEIKHLLKYPANLTSSNNLRLQSAKLKVSNRAAMQAVTGRPGLIQLIKKEDMIGKKIQSAKRPNQMKCGHHLNQMLKKPKKIHERLAMEGTISNMINPTAINFNQKCLSRQNTANGQ